MVAQREGTASGHQSSHHSKNGTLPTMENLRDQDLTKLVDSLVESKERRRQIWKEEMERMGKVPDQEQKEDDDKDETSSSSSSPLSVLRSILIASTAPKQSSPFSSSSANVQQSNSESGSSTPSNRPTASTSGTKTPVEDVSIQMVYQAVFCFWLFSFDEEIAGELNAKFGIIPLLADVARNAVKEKVVRVIVATLKNLAEKAPNANVSAMLGSKCLPLMESLSARRWSDEEITQDIDVVKELLGEKLKGMR